jgi:hypothetical protein
MNFQDHWNFFFLHTMSFIRQKIRRNLRIQLERLFSKLQDPLHARCIAHSLILVNR